ncbi:MAG: hypothetical protein MUC78_10530 [Bacteroidales bacterium]|jgi:hypothetical protein|nr:hypothetical protein [Bacteroidales bacterium]
MKLKHILLFSAFTFAVINATGQTTIPKELTSGPIEEQIKYLEDKTRIYENYRAIREDMYQKLNRNVIDSIRAEKGRIAELRTLTSDLNSKNDSLKTLLDKTRVDLEQATTTKNSLSVLGIEVNKGVYNTIMWTVIGGLAILLALGFLVFKRNLVVLRRTEKDLKELKDEFAAYRQTTRLAREKAEMDHFNAIRKLKGG